MRAPLVCMICLSLTLAGCRPDSATLGEPRAASGALVTAAKAEGGVRLANSTDRRVAFNVRNPDWLGLLAACTDPGTGCARLAPGASVVVPFAEIAGYVQGTREVTVTWWHVVDDGAGGHRVDELRELTVSL